MSGRNRVPRDVIDPRHGYPYPPQGPVIRHLARPIPHPALLEEELQIRHAELRRLLGENRRLVEDRIALERDLKAAKEELRRMSIAIDDIRADQESQSRKLIERGMKLEADLRAAEPLKHEAAELRAEIQRLNSMKKDLSGKIQNVSQDLAKLRAENKQIPGLRAEIDGLRHELSRARAAIDYEKTANVELMEQRQAMEKNLVTMAREVEMLRSDIANSGARAWNSGGPYGVNFSNPDVSFPTPYADGYLIHQGALDNSSLYGLGSSSRTGPEKPRMTRR